MTPQEIELFFELREKMLKYLEIEKAQLDEYTWGIYKQADGTPVIHGEKAYVGEQIYKTKGNPLRGHSCN
jgi:phosphopentomutase